MTVSYKHLLHLMYTPNDILEFIGDSEKERVDNV